jgi:hypothetical protein
MLANGKRRFPTAIQLVLVDSRGAEYRTAPTVLSERIGSSQLSQPLRIGHGSIEVMTRLIQFVLPRLRRPSCFGQQTSGSHECTTRSNAQSQSGGCGECRQLGLDSSNGKKRFFCYFWVELSPCDNFRIPRIPAAIETQSCVACCHHPAPRRANPSVEKLCKSAPQTQSGWRVCPESPQGPCWAARNSDG